MKLTAAQLAQWDDSHQPALYGVLGTLLVLSNLSLVLRIIAVLKQRKRLLVEDWCMIVAVIFSDGIIASLLAATYKGFGLHMFRVLATDPNRPMILLQIFEIIWAYAVMNGFCFLTIKLSILFFYRRLFFVNRWFKIAWQVNLVYAVLWFLGSTLFYIFQCTPVDFYWTRLGAVVPNPAIPVDPNGRCVSSIASIGTPIMLNTVSDLVILLLPVPVLFKLKTTLDKRLRLVFLLSLGLIAVVAGFVRFGVIFQSQSAEDQTYTAFEFLLWSNIEEVVGIVCANIPLIVAFLDSKNNGSSASGGLSKDNSKWASTGRSAVLNSVPRTDIGRGHRAYEQLEAHPLDNMGGRSLGNGAGSRSELSQATSDLPPHKLTNGDGIIVRTDMEQYLDVEPV